MKLKITKQWKEIPKGYRRIEDYEVLKEQRTNKKLYKLLKKGFVACNRLINGKQVVRACWLNFFNSDSDFFAVDRYVDNGEGLRGVFVKKELRK